MTRPVLALVHSAHPTELDLVDALHRALAEGEALEARLLGLQEQIAKLKAEQETRIARILEIKAALRAQWGDE